jgi:hypothetical protein
MMKISAKEVEVGVIGRTTDPVLMDNDNLSGAKLTIRVTAGSHLVQCKSRPPLSLRSRRISPGQGIEPLVEPRRWLSSGCKKTPAAIRAMMRGLR